MCFSTPFIAASSGVTTLFITVSAFAPVYVALTLTVGGAMSGYCSMGRLNSPSITSITIVTDSIADIIGRLVKVFMSMTDADFALCAWAVSVRQR